MVIDDAYGGSAGWSFSCELECILSGAFYRFLNYRLIPYALV